jgi:hypothetical protein
MRYRYLLLLCFVLVMPIAGFFGCTTTIRCPPPGETGQTVYLVDYGHTSALVLPKASNAGNTTQPKAGMVYYAYGDFGTAAREVRRHG